MEKNQRKSKELGRLDELRKRGGVEWTKPKRPSKVEVGANGGQQNSVGDELRQGSGV